MREEKIIRTKKTNIRNGKHKFNEKKTNKR